MKEQHPPSLTKDFIEYAKNLNITGDVFKFFQYYGTHFMISILCGARFVYKNKLKQELKKTKSKSGMSLAVQAQSSERYRSRENIGITISIYELILIILFTVFKYKKFVTHC